MFSKKKKPDQKAEQAAPAAADAAATAAEPAAPAAAGEEAAPEAPTGGGLMGAGLASKGKTPGISASRLGGRPPSRPSAPAPEPPPPPPEPAFTAPQAPAVPFGGAPAPANASMSGQPAAAAAPGKSNTVQGQEAAPASSLTGIPAPEGADDGKAKKNPYKLNPLFDVVLPVSMALVCLVGFGYTLKFPKEKHDIYGLTEAEKETQVKVKDLADPKIMDDVKKMEPVKMLDAGDTAGAMTAAKDLGLKANQTAAEKGMGKVNTTVSTAPTKDDLALEDKTVRNLLAAGLVMCKAGNKQEKEMGLNYMAKAAEIATYSKYVRLLYARELVKAGKNDEAVAEYNKITTLFLDPWPIAHKELALLDMRTNRGTEAVQEFKDLMKADPGDPSYQRWLGLAMAQAGDQQAGFEEFRKGFTREQDVLSYPAAVKGLVDAHGGLVEATLQDVKKQAEKNPQDIKLQLDLARLYIATGKIKDARDLMETARKTQELNPEVHEVLAEIMVRQSQAQSGYDEFRSAAQNLLRL